MFKALHGGQNGWEASERQCGAGGGCSYKTLWVVLRTLDFILSWMMLSVSNGGASRYELLFQSTFLTGFAQVTGDQGQKEILLTELEC